MTSQDYTIKFPWGIKSMHVCTNDCLVSHIHIPQRKREQSYMHGPY